MADASSSSEESEISDPNNHPIQLAINKGAHITEPERASISRKRKINVNSGKYKASRVKNVSKNNTSVWDKVKEFPDQHFASINGKLRCNACSEVVSKKKSSIEKHVKSKKHLNGITSIAKSKKESQTILECLQRQDKRDHASGSTLPDEMRLFRFELVETLLLAGIPISKIDIMRPLLEKYAHR